MKQDSRSSRRNTAIIVLCVIACLITVFLATAILHEAGYIDASAIFGPRRSSMKIGDMSDSYTIRGGLHGLSSPSPSPENARATTPSQENDIYEASTGESSSWTRYVFTFYSDGGFVLTINGIANHGSWVELEGMTYYTYQGKMYEGYFEGDTFITNFNGELLVLSPA